MKFRHSIRRKIIKNILNPTIIQASIKIGAGIIPINKYYGYIDKKIVNQID